MRDMVLPSMLGALWLVSGCGRPTVAPAPQGAAAAAAAEPSAAHARVAPSSAAPARPGRLPEDPAAGLRAQRQWREHLEHEEEERQMIFDRPRLGSHRAVVRQIEAARASYDAARTEAGVARVRAAMPARLSKIRARVIGIDKWGNNSPLLPHYEALIGLLAQDYAEARIAAIGGQSAALAQARANYDQRMTQIDHWLEEVEHDEDEW